jgi:hypothetical protein
MTRKRTSPEDMQKTADYARQQLPCEDCTAAAGEPCASPGPGKTVCQSRYRSAMITLDRAARAARRTPAEAAELERLLADLPRVSREQIEACRKPDGAYSFTAERLASWGVPWPPPAGWRRAIERGQDDDGEPGPKDITERTTTS